MNANNKHEHTYIKRVFLRLAPFITFMVFFVFMADNCLAIFTELGASYGRKRTSFDSDNYFDSESITGSISFYFFEQVALETSYTDAKGIRQEKITTSQGPQTTTVIQTTQVTGADLILVLADRKARIQPYIKGGLAQINRKQEVKINTISYVLNPESATVPSYGAGFKIGITQNFGIKVSYDAWQTPIGGGSVTNDSQVRAGVTWVL